MITISDMLSETWNTLQSHYQTYGIYLCLFALPVIVASLLQPTLLDMNPETGLALFTVKNSIIGGITQLIVTFLTLYFSIAAIFSSYTILTQQVAPDIKADIKKSGHLLLPTFVLSLLVSVAITVGFLLLIIPGIIVTIWLTFSYHVYILEHTTIIEAMKKSKALVTGQFWIIFAHLAVLTIGIALFVFLITLIPTIILPMLGLDVLLPFITTIMSSASAVAILVGLTVLYLSARSRPILPTPQTTNTQMTV